ncbi:MAG: TIGR04540 family protein [Clostridia bacterium]|jgi:uncharacterized protein (TIGR04540 family)|nr:TIGR04540 family protein [Clostridia bacterium]
MQYKDTRSMANAIRDEIDLYISKSISREHCTEFIRGILSCEYNKRKLFKAKGLSSTVETVLGKDRLSLFKVVLKELGLDI